MPVYQSQSNVEVSYKVEATPGVLPGATGAKRFRLNSGGLSLSQAVIASGELRGDMKTGMTRAGSRAVTGGYPADLSVSTFDELIEAALRGTWQAASVITFATMTSITTLVDGIVAASGSWLTQGVRVGQVVRLTGHSTAGNNGKNLRVVGVTATKITVPTGELIVDAVADATGSVDISKRVAQPSTIVRRSFTFEENEKDIDGSKLFKLRRVNGLEFAGGPDAMATLNVGLVGADMEIMTGATSPYFTTPTLSGTIGLTMADARLRFGGEDLTVLSGLNVALGNSQAGVAVIGGRITPDIFDGRAAISGSITGIRRDLINVQRALDETELELHALFTEPETEPKDFISLFLGRIKLGVPTGELGGEGAYMETLPFTVGNKEVVTGYDDSMIVISTSAA